MESNSSAVGPKPPESEIYVSGVVETGAIAKVAVAVNQDGGCGVYNVSGRTLETGALLGPFKGGSQLIKAAEYKAKVERPSPYAFRVTGLRGVKTAGWIDPGPNPDLIKDWFSFVNCTRDEMECNVMAIHYANQKRGGQILFRVVKDIPAGGQLFGYGGDHTWAIAGKKARKESKNECKACKKTFLHYSSLKRHLGNHYSAADSYLYIDQAYEDLKSNHCEICGVTLRNLQEMKMHIVEVHDGERPEPCLYCDAKFVYKAHLRTHVGIRHPEMSREWDEMEGLVKIEPQAYQEEEEQEETQQVEEESDDEKVEEVEENEGVEEHEEEEKLEDMTDILCMIDEKIKAVDQECSS